MALEPGTTLGSYQVTANVDVGRVALNSTVVDPRGVGGRRDHIIASLNLEQKARDLPHLLADDDVACIVRVRLLVEGIELLSALYR